MPENPTADDVWALRARLRVENRYNVTQDINIVWIPALSTSEVIDLVSESEDEDQPNKYGWTVRTMDARRCDPTNGGPGTHVDQSGTPGKAKYCLATKAGQNIVADQSPAIRGQLEEHLFNIRGVHKWLRFKQADTMDWHNTNHIKKLNDFRTQNFRRGIYELTTRADRESYISDETKWLTDEVRKDLSRGLQSVKDLMREFNAKFHASREENGMGIKRSRVLTKLRAEALPSDGSQGNGSKKRRIDSPKRLNEKLKVKGSLTHVVRDAVTSVKETLSRRSLRSGTSRESAAEPGQARARVHDGQDQSGSDEYMNDGRDLGDSSE